MNVCLRYKRGGNGLRKSLLVFLVLILALPVSAFGKSNRLEVEVNGVELDSDANYKKRKPCVCRSGRVFRFI